MTDHKTGIHILPTKLNRPAIDSRWIVRPRLLSALDECLDKRVTLMSAPAGYGKTTLAAQWLDHIPLPSAWLSLDEQDSDPDRFLRYLISSIRKIFPRFGPRIEPLLSSPTLPPANHLADVLISDLAAMAKPLVLVFDDFHSTQSRTVQMMSRLVQHLPDHLHLVITTRMDPALPLAQWRVRNWLVEIRAADLRFLPEETHAYFASPLEEQLSNESIEQIAARTEGWVAGLQMARLSLGVTDNPEALARSLSGCDRIIVDFLMDEVISRQPDEIIRFLAVTSMLERFCAALCDHVFEKESGLQYSRRLIASVANDNLFLVPLDSKGHWYRYHHLFQTLLFQHAGSTLRRNRQVRIHRRAGQWYASRGYMEDALRHLIAAGDLDAAAALVDENLHAVIDRDNSRRTLGRWLEMFPEESEKQRPTLLVAHAFQKMFHWDLSGMVSLLGQAESLLKDLACSIPETRRKSLLGDIGVQRAFCHYWQGDTESALRHSGECLQGTVPKEHRYAHALAVSYTAGAKAHSGQMDESLSLLDEALTADCSAGSLNAGHLLATKMAILLYAADLHAVEVNARKIMNVHETATQPDYWLGYGPYFLGSVAYERNLLDVAADQFGRVEQMRYRVNTRLYHDALIGLMLVAWARGDKEEAKTHAAGAFSFAIEANDPYSMQISDSIQLRLAILSGNLSADPEPVTSTIDGTRFWLESPSLTHAEYLVNRGNHGDCSVGLECVEKGLKTARNNHNVRLEIQLMAVKAVALKCAGGRNEALELLEKTLKLAEPHGLVRSFVDRGPGMAELLTALSAKRTENLYAKSLLDAFRDKPPSEKIAAKDSENPTRTEQSADPIHSYGLSNRELDILMLLSERLTNKQIAERLYISPVTVKAHNLNIYRKLNVHSRRQAAVRAEQLGLLPRNSA